MNSKSLCFFDFKPNFRFIRIFLVFEVMVMDNIIVVNINIGNELCKPSRQIKTPAATNKVYY